jgi:hypothetical protein
MVISTVSILRSPVDEGLAQPAPHPQENDADCTDLSREHLPVCSGRDKRALARLALTLLFKRQRASAQRLRAACAKRPERSD